MMWVALVHDQEDPTPGLAGALDQLPQEPANAPGILARLRVMAKQPPAVAPGAEDRDFAVPPRRGDPLLPTAPHPHGRQIRVEVELGLVLEPEFVIGTGPQGPLFSRRSSRWALRKAFSSRFPLRVCFGRRKT